jgi:hypothetical protein
MNQIGHLGKLKIYLKKFYSVPENNENVFLDFIFISLVELIGKFECQVKKKLRKRKKNFHVN